MEQIVFDRDAPVIILDVKLTATDTKTVRMALDTGCTSVLLPWDVAEMIGLDPAASKERIETVTASGIEYVPVVTIPKISVLGNEAFNIRAIIHDLPPKSYVEGLLGLSFLKNFKLIIDFTEGSLSLE